MNEEQSVKTEIILKAHDAATRADEILTAAQWDMPHPSRYSEEFAQRWCRVRRAVQALRQLTRELSGEL